MDIGRQITELEVQHQGKDLTFLLPHYKGTYSELKEQIEAEGARYCELIEQIDGDGLRMAMATMPETISIVHDALCSEQRDPEEKEYADEIKKLLWDWGFHADTTNLWVPERGVYTNINLIPLPEDFTYTLGEPLSERVLERMLRIVRKHDGFDGLVRFVPFDFKTGYLSSKELRKSKYLRAFAGEEGVEKLAELSSKLSESDGPTISLGGYDSRYDPPRITNSHICSNNCEYDGLFVYGGNDCGGHWVSRAFAVLKNPKNAAKR